MHKDQKQLNDSFLAHFGDAIRNRRINLLLSQEQLGVRAHLHRTYITE